MKEPTGLIINNPWVFLILKLIILGILYAFIYKVVSMVSKDIGDLTDGKRRPHQADTGDSAISCMGETYGLVVAKSSAEGIRPGMRYPINKDITIGRGTNNSIQIKDSFVSHEHARLSRRGDKFLVEDLQSKNGTLVDGKPVKRVVSLSEGALLQIGGVTFKLVRWENEGS